jgi:hypothetical protein
MLDAYHEVIVELYTKELESSTLVGVVLVVSFDVNE